MAKYRKGQTELHCVFVGLEKAYDTVSHCVRKSGVAEKYVGVVQDMYKDKETLVRWGVKGTCGF